MNNRLGSRIRGVARIGFLSAALLLAGVAEALAQGAVQPQSAIQQGSIRVQDLPESVSLASKASISMGGAITAAMKAYPGAVVLTAEITTVKNSLVYKVQVSDPSSASGTTTVVIDAGNAKILGTLSDRSETTDRQDGEYQGEHSDNAGEHTDRAD